MTDLEAGLVSADAEKLARFYQHALDFTLDLSLEYPQGTVHRLSRGHARLKIHQPSGPVGPSPRATDWSGSSGWAYAALHVDDAETEAAAVRIHGGAVLQDATEHRPGARYALVADPEGNVWELLEERP